MSLYLQLGILSGKVGNGFSTILSFRLSSNFLQLLGDIGSSQRAGGGSFGLLMMMKM